MIKTMFLDKPEQIRALAHPIRMQALQMLATQPMTNQQLAAELDESAGRIHFHISELKKAGLISIVEERPNGSILEKYYAAVAETFQLALEDRKLEPPLLKATLEAAYRDLARAELDKSDVRVLQDKVRLSNARLNRIRRYIDKIESEFKDARNDTVSSDTPITAITILFHPTA